jgi:hypothetical protein
MRSRIAAAFSGVTKDLLPKAGGAPRGKREAAPRREAAPEKGGAGGAAPAHHHVDAQDFERALAAVEARIDQMSDEEVTAFAKRIGILR